MLAFKKHTQSHIVVNPDQDSNKIFTFDESFSSDESETTMDNQEPVFASSTNETIQDDNIPILPRCHLGRIKTLQVY